MSPAYCLQQGQTAELTAMTRAGDQLIEIEGLARQACEAALQTPSQLSSTAASVLPRDTDSDAESAASRLSQASDPTWIWMEAHTRLQELAPLLTGLSDAHAWLRQAEAGQQVRAWAVRWASCMNVAWSCLADDAAPMT